MAEIKIEKKKPVWPWILLLLILIGALVFYFWWSDRDILEDDVSNTDTEQVIGAKRERNYMDTSRTTSEELEAFLSGMDDSSKIGPDVA